MGKIVQNNFSGGVLSPSLYGRSDLQSYYKGCAKAENFIVTKEGTLRKRRGVRSFASIGSYASCRIVPYKYDRTNGGFLILSADGESLKCDFWRKDDVEPRSSVTVAGFSGSVKEIQAKQIGDEIWMANGAMFSILTITDNSTISSRRWSQAGQPAAVKSFAANGFDANGNPYDGSGETAYHYCAYIVKGGVSGKRRTSVAYQKKSWVAGAYTNCTVTLSAEQRDSMDYVVIAKSMSGSTSYGEIVRYYPEDFGSDLSLTFVDKNVSPGAGVYMQTNVLGKGFANPLCVDCFQQRRVFANATADGMKLPMTLWFSEVGNLSNFYADRPSADDDPFSPTISSTGPSFIRWMCCYQENMVLFTEAGLFAVGFSQSQGFSAASCRISRFSHISISPSVQPVVTDAGVVFLGGDGKTLYTAGFDLQENSLKPVNRSVLTEHLTRTSKIVAIALQEYPDNVVWCVTEDGRALSFTFERNEEVYAWSHSRIRDARIVDAVSLGTVTDGDSSRTHSDIVFVVEKGGEHHLARFADCHEDDIGGERSNVRAELVTLRPESQERSISGLQKSVKDILLRLYETGGVSVVPVVGSDSFQLVPAKMKGPKLFTGDVKVMPRGYINEAGQMTYVSDNDKPCEILQVVTTLEVNG